MTLFLTANEIHLPLEFYFCDFQVPFSRTVGSDIKVVGI